jgi:ABC-type transport system involved in multi-copper enzyme maturation permease subunit
VALGNLTFLPIVQRELRAAARRKATYRTRWWTAVLALGGILAAFMLFGLTGGLSGLGGQLFTVLSAYAFGLALLAGVLFTADALSEEKREGTLGFLFLTDLKGYDVVLGKFIARSLNAFYGLLALLPLLALPVMLGGLTGAEFWRMALALANALGFSLALGLCVSTFGEDSQRCLRNAFALLLFMTGALPALAELATFAGITSSWLHLLSLSPFYPFLWARSSLYAAHSADFWTALLASHLTAWSFLALASWALPRLWQQKALATGNRGLLRRLRWPSFFQHRGTAAALDASAPESVPAKARETRGRLLAINPVLWLLHDERGLRGMVWLVLTGWGVAVFFVTWQWSGMTAGLIYPAKVCGFLLKMIVAFQACRFFVQARRDGTLEVLLCTPLRNHEILHGQWLALKRLILLPTLLAILVAFVPFAVDIAVELSQPGPAQAGTALLRLAWAVLGIGWFATNLVVDFYAVTWVGMWLALSSKNPGLATARTILYVLVLPSIGVCGVDMLVDLFLILWSSSRLHEDFRWVLARQYQSPVQVLSTLRPVPA